MKSPPRVVSTTSKLDHVCELITDGTHQSPETFPEGDFLYITSKNVRSGQLDLNEVCYVTRDVHESIYAACPVRRGDVLLVKDGVNTGMAAMNTLDKPFSMLSSVAMLRPDATRLDARYLAHWLNSPVGRSLMARNMSGSAIRRLVLREIRVLTLPLPSLAEQQRIAAILDHAVALLGIRTTSVRESEYFGESLFFDSFVKGNPRWPWLKIKDVSTSMRTGPFGSQLLHSEFTTAGIPVLGIDNAVQNRFAWGRPRFISETKFGEMERYRVFPGDVLITIMATCGRCAIVPDDIPVAINSKHLCCITLDRKQALPRYLHACFRYHPAILNQLGVRQRGAVMPGLNMGVIQDLSIPVPAVEIQRRFSDQVARIDRFSSVLDDAMERTRALFRSLQEDAFRGRL